MWKELNSSFSPFFKCCTAPYHGTKTSNRGSSSPKLLTRFCVSFVRECQTWLSMTPLCAANFVFLSGPVRLILPKSSHFAHSVFEPRWELVKCDHQSKVQDELFDTLLSKQRDVSNPMKDDDMIFDRTKCGPKCMSASLSAFRSCENCCQFLAFGTAHLEAES